jgi:hypothetical protein
MQMLEMLDNVGRTVKDDLTITISKGYSADYGNRIKEAVLCSIP